MGTTLQVKCVNNGRYNVFYMADDEYIGPTIAAGYEWDEWMRKDAQKYFKEGTEILDIGANIGYNSLMFSDYGPVYAFEPLFHKVVKLNVENNKLKHNMYVIPIALSDENKTIDMYFQMLLKQPDSEIMVDLLHRKQMEWTKQLKPLYRVTNWMTSTKVHLHS